MNGSSINATVSYDTLKNAAESLNNYKTQMIEILSEVDNQIDKLNSSNVWENAAAESLKNEYKSVSSKFSEYSDAVGNCAKFLLDYVSDLEAVQNQIQGGLK